MDGVIASGYAVDRVKENARYFRKAKEQTGLAMDCQNHFITPILLGDAKLAQEFSRELLAEGILAISFFEPVVPQGKARIRSQISAAHTSYQLDKAISAFSKVGRKLKVIS